MPRERRRPADLPRLQFALVSRLLEAGCLVTSSLDQLLTAELVADVQHLGRHLRAGSISRAEAVRRLTADWPACRHQAGVLLNEWRELHAKTGEQG